MNNKNDINLLICAGSTKKREDSMVWLKKQLRNPKHKLGRKKQIQEALNLVKNMTQEEFIDYVNNNIQDIFYSNYSWK